MIYHSKNKMLVKKCVNKTHNDTIFFPTFPTNIKILILNKLNIKKVLEKLWKCWKVLENVFNFQHFPTKKHTNNNLNNCKSIL